jgi:subtilisin family serine protease/subtilisin-like proprotein convertase family protein
MKKYILILPAVMLLYSFAAYNSSYTFSSSKVTNYYYYRGNKFFLKERTDIIFLKFKEEITEQNARNVLSLFSEVDAAPTAQNIKDAEFVKLKTRLSDDSYISLINEMKKRPEFKHVGFAYAPENSEGDKFLFGMNNEFIAQFKAPLTKIEIDNINSRSGAEIVQRIDVTGGATYLMKVSDSSPSDAMSMANKYYLEGYTNYAEPNLYCTNTKTDTTNDQFFGMQWSIRNLGNNVPANPPGVIADADMDVDSAWMVTRGDTNIKIAIIDTGVDTNHVDLKPNLRVDLGYDFVNNVPGGYPNGNDGHGTSCAGISAGVGNNTIGIAGVAYRCKIIPIRCIGTGSSPFHVYANGFIWAYQKGADVISNSWGITGGASSLLNNAISDAARYGRNGKGSVICFASGNEDTSPMRFPSISHPDIIVVGGLTPCNKRKSPSDGCSGETWGASFGNNLDIVAPCVKIYATALGGGYTNSFNGTSSATPNTSGVCALMLSANPNLTRKEVESYLSLSAEKVGAYAYTTVKEYGNWNNEMGYGRVNSRLALALVSGGADNVSPVIYHDKPVLSGASAVQQVTAIIKDNKKVATGSNAPRLYYRVGAGAFTFLNASVISADTFKFQIPAQSPGATIEYYLAAQDTAATPNVTTLPAGGSGINPPGTTAPAERFSYRTGLIKSAVSTTTPKICNDMQTIRDTIFISGQPNEGALDVEVKLNLSHRNLSDVDVILRHDSRQSELTTDNGGSGDSYVNTIFDDQAGTSITAGTPPYTGRFRPETPLTTFNDQLINGYWILEYTDDASGGNTGTLDSWELEIRYSIFLGIVNTNTIPSGFSLGQNYPNPFNPATNIKFGLPSKSNVTLEVFDLSGRLVTTLLDNVSYEAGFHDVRFNGGSFSSGVYFYRIKTDKDISVKKMLLIK